MEKEEERDAGVQSLSGAAPRHIKKRALRNKALSVSFSDKDLKDYVTGFHKRKKKRRKEAERQIQEKERLKRIQQRKKRKLEKELALYGGVLPEEILQRTGSGPDEGDADLEDNCEQSMPVSGTKVYDIGEEMTITVTTSEISHEDEKVVALSQVVSCSGSEVKPKYSLAAKKKPLKKVTKPRPRKKSKKSVSQKKGKKKTNRR